MNHCRDVQFTNNQTVVTVGSRQQQLAVDQGKHVYVCVCVCVCVSIDLSSTGLVLSNIIVHNRIHFL